MMTTENNLPETEWVRPDVVPVNGPFKCTVHPDAKTFVYVYSTKTYHHVHKNGGLCKHPVLLKNKKLKKENYVDTEVINQE